MVARPLRNWKRAWCGMLALKLKWTPVARGKRQKYRAHISGKSVEGRLRQDTIASSLKNTYEYTRRHRQRSLMLTFYIFLMKKRKTMACLSTSIRTLSNTGPCSPTGIRNQLARHLRDQLTLSINVGIAVPTDKCQNQRLPSTSLSIVHGQLY